MNAPNPTPTPTAQQLLAGKQALLDVVVQQRNEAQNKVAELSAQLSIAMAEIDRLNAELEATKALVPPAAANETPAAPPGRKTAIARAARGK
jgi:uncharacterized small protein (DUF1192 family)